MPVIVHLAVIIMSVVVITTHGSAIIMTVAMHVIITMAVVTIVIHVTVSVMTIIVHIVVMVVIAVAHMAVIITAIVRGRTFSIVVVMAHVAIVVIFFAVLSRVVMRQAIATDRGPDVIGIRPLPFQPQCLTATVFHIAYFDSVAARA